VDFSESMEDNNIEGVEPSWIIFEYMFSLVFLAKFLFRAIYVKPSIYFLATVTSFETSPPKICYNNRCWNVSD
jgi:hypothetical protein